jgi:protein ImuB
MRWSALLLPSLPLDVFARACAAHEAPFVVHGEGRVPRIVAANAAAEAAGVRAGMLLSAAIALAPDVVQQTRDLAAEEDALAQLATFALRFTPAVSVGDGALLAEIGASLRLFGGEAKLVGALADGVRERGFDARLGLAPTPLAALAVARAGAPPIGADEDLALRLAPLPLAHFDVGEAALATLAAAGVHTFGDASRLPRAGLARRFGRALVVALDRALGRVPDPRTPYVPPPAFAAKLELPSTVHDVAALAFAVHRLVQDLCAWLLARGLGATGLVLALSHERALVRRLDSPRTEARFALASPSRTPAHLSHVMRERLARLALPAPVAAIALATEAVAPLAGRTFALLPGSEHEAPEVPLVDRLRARLGEDAVRLVVPQADHRPERAMRAPAVGHEVPPAPASMPEAPRPTWLLAQPRPLAALLEAQPWVLREGPERIESGWWDGRDVRRDYFVAESPAGEIAWVYRDHRRGTDDGEWFLHGLFA